MLRKRQPNGDASISVFFKIIIGGNGKHYKMIIMQAMVMKMMLDGYGINFYVCCCDFIWIPVLMVCWFMVYSLSIKSLCMDKSWTYKREKVEDTGGGHRDKSSYGGCSGGSSERYTAGGDTDACAYRDSAASGRGYSADGLYVRCSGKDEVHCGRYRGHDKRAGV